jgi:hypothetical protein
MNAGQLVVMCTSTPSSSYIVGGHAYAVVGYNALSSQPFTVLNPWGGSTSSVWCIQDNQVYGLFTATASFLSANFTWYSTGTGTGIEALSIQAAGDYLFAQARHHGFAA